MTLEAFGRSPWGYSRSAELLHPNTSMREAGIRARPKPAFFRTRTFGDGRARLSKRDRAVVIADRGFAVDDAGPGAGDALDDGREAPVRSLPGWLYSLMPKFVLGSIKNDRTQPHAQRPIDRNLHAGLRRSSLSA